MTGAGGICPACGLVLEANGADGPAVEGLLACPGCQTRFSPAALAALPPAGVVPQTPRKSTTADTRQALLGAAAVAVLAFLAGGIVLAFQLAPRETPRARPAPPETAERQADPSPEEVGTVPDVLGGEGARLNEFVEPPAPKPEKKASRPPAVLPATAPLEERVNRAIDRGVAYLRKVAQAPPQAEYAALCGLTLLACRVPADDSQVRALAGIVRDEQAQLNRTYGLALSLLFLDLLGNPEDERLIRTLALRLAAGQTAGGGWTYHCPLLRPQEEQQVLAELRARVFSSPRDPRQPDGMALPLWPPQRPVHQTTRRPARPQPSRGRAAQKPQGFGGDHSNAQFALLALWTAERHGVPMRWVLRRSELYFRGAQAEDGSWGYTAHSSVRRSANSCAGLLALAMGLGVDNRPLPHTGEATRMTGVGSVQDPAITAGMRFLNADVSRMKGRAPGEQVFGGLLGMAGRLVGADSGGDLYFLWSLERVAVIYDLERIGGRDWYRWAAGVLVEAQTEDGSWRERFAGPIDTCFALLVLRRTNLTPDLTRSLQGVIQVEGRRQPRRGAASPGADVRGQPRPPLSGTTVPTKEGRRAPEGTAVERPGEGK
jgi:hypothetical protein